MPVRSVGVGGAGRRQRDVGDASLWAEARVGRSWRSEIRLERICQDGQARSGEISGEVSPPRARGRWVPCATASDSGRVVAERAARTEPWRQAGWRVGPRSVNLVWPENVRGLAFAWHQKVL